MFVAPRRVELAPVEIGRPAPGQALVRTLHSGISTGTELLCYRGLLDPDVPLDERIGSLGGTFRYPFPCGHRWRGGGGASRGTIPAGTLGFRLHPHQDLFVVPEADVLVLPEGTDP